MSEPRRSSTGSDSNRGGDSTQNSNNKRSKLQLQPDQSQCRMQEELKSHEKAVLEQLQQRMQEELLMLDLWEQELLERLQRKKNKTGFLQ